MTTGNYVVPKGRFKGANTSLTVTDSRIRHIFDSDSGSVDGEAVAAKASSPVGSHKGFKGPDYLLTSILLCIILQVLEAVDSGTQFDEKTSVNNPLDRNKYVCFDQLEQTSQAKSSSVESDCHQDGESAPAERQVSPEKLYRAAILKNRFADTILKAREKTLTAQGENVDPEQLRREREELEHLKEARLLAEAKAAEDAQRRAEAEAAAEARRKRELERDATRQALLKDSCKPKATLEMLRAAPAEYLPSSVDETSPEHSQDGLSSFKLGSNPLEQLGLYMKKDEDEEGGEPPIVPNAVTDPEDGEID
ncbi:Transcription factor GTE9 [Hibiscus syriacus]|uniref:Transcription factor GTE9 n=1 Tax=Hibiscus syriacus TaxID=106335 RepID=A0A6A2ZBS5_HIBSY|nr:Transcription factor GTE9 [Hibiscus syriacus]